MKHPHLMKLPLFLLLISIVFVLYTQTHQFLTVDGVSMQPTLENGDICILEDIFEPELGEIYIVQEPDNDIIAVKRLVGLPGDVVEFVEGKVYVNGERFREDIKGSFETVVFKLGIDEYLFVGDNRGESYDGRFWSRFLCRKEILYHVTTRVYPVSHMGTVG